MATSLQRPLCSVLKIALVVLVERFGLGKQISRRRRRPFLHPSPGTRSYLRSKMFLGPVSCYDKKYFGPEFSILCLLYTIYIYWQHTLLNFYNLGNLLVGNQMHILLSSMNGSFIPAANLLRFAPRKRVHSPVHNVIDNKQHWKQYSRCFIDAVSCCSTVTDVS